MNHLGISKQSSFEYPSFISSLLRLQIAQTNWAETFSAGFQNSLLNKWLMLCFGRCGTIDGCNHDQAMPNLPSIKVRAVSSLTLLAALESSLMNLFWIQVIGYVKHILKSSYGNRKAINHHRSSHTLQLLQPSMPTWLCTS